MIIADGVLRFQLHDHLVCKEVEVKYHPMTFIYPQGNWFILHFPI